MIVYTHWRVVLMVLGAVVVTSTVLPPLSASATLPASPSASTTKIPDDPERITLDEALLRFQEHSLELQRSRAQATEQSARGTQDLAFPNPELEVSHEPLFRGSDRAWEAYAVIHQPIEWPGHRSTAREVATQTHAAAQAGAQVDSLRLVQEAAQAYIAAAAAEAHLASIEATLHLFERADSTYQRQYAEGEVSGYAIERFRVAYARIINQHAEAELEVDDTRRTLNRLIQADTNGAALAPAELPDLDAELPAVQEAQTRAAQQRPALMRIEAERATAEAAQRVAQQDRIPSPTLMGGYKRQSDGFEGMFFGAEIPIPAFDRNRPQIRAEQARLEAAETTHLLLQREIEDEVRTAHAAYTSVTERRTRLATTGASPDALLSQAQSQYDEGEMELSDLLDAAETYAESRSMAIDLKADQWMRYLDLLRAMGETP